MRINKPRRTLKNRSYYIHHRKRIIAKRIKIIKQNSYWLDDVIGDRRLEQPGRLAKDNTSCNCWLCKWEKKNKITKPKYKLKEEYYEFLE